MTAAETADAAVGTASAVAATVPRLPRNIGSEMSIVIIFFAFLFLSSNHQTMRLGTRLGRIALHGEDADSIA